MAAEKTIAELETIRGRATVSMDPRAGMNAVVRIRTEILPEAPTPPSTSPDGRVRHHIVLDPIQAAALGELLDAVDPLRDGDDPFASANALGKALTEAAATAWDVAGLAMADAAAQASAALDEEQ